MPPSSRHYQALGMVAVLVEGKSLNQKRLPPKLVFSTNSALVAINARRSWTPLLSTRLKPPTHRYIVRNVSMKTLGRGRSRYFGPIPPPFFLWTGMGVPDVEGRFSSKRRWWRRVATSTSAVSPARSATGHKLTNCRCSWGRTRRSIVATAILTLSTRLPLVKPLQLYRMRTVALDVVGRFLRRREWQRVVGSSTNLASPAASATHRSASPPCSALTRGRSPAKAATSRTSSLGGRTSTWTTARSERAEAWVQ